MLVETSRVHSISMEPTILPGDVILVKKAAYALRIPFTHLRLLDTGTPRRGDVVVFEDPRDPGSDYVKRVVGVPGDMVELREQVLHVNGVAQPRTPAGDYAVAGGTRAGARAASICRRYREALARGVLLTPPAGEAGGKARPLGCGGRRGDGELRRAAVPARAHRLARGAFRGGEACARLRAWATTAICPPTAEGWADGRSPYGHIRGRVSLVLFSWGEGGWSPHGAIGAPLSTGFSKPSPRARTQPDAPSAASSSPAARPPRGAVSWVSLVLLLLLAGGGYLAGPGSPSMSSTSR